MWSTKPMAGAALAVCVLLTACARSHQRLPDAGSLEPCPVPLGSARLTLGEERRPIRPYAYAQESALTFAAYVDGSDMFSIDEEDGCGYGSSWGGYRSPPALPEHDVLLIVADLTIDCDDLSIPQRVELPSRCRDDGCLRNLVECRGESCASLTLSGATLAASIRAEGGEPSFCADLEATTSDGRPLRLELNVVLNHCFGC